MMLSEDSTGRMMLSTEDSTGGMILSTEDSTSKMMISGNDIVNVFPSILQFMLIFYGNLPVKGLF